MGFLDFLWLLLLSFLFVSYLFVLWYILIDLFRDRKLSGWAKAIWVIFLIIFPIITALVYLIARGGGMADRAAADAVEQKTAMDAYIRQTAGSATPSDQIAQAKTLLDNGTITQAEYDKLKAKALA